jgi:hypothetical protein
VQIVHSLRRVRLVASFGRKSAIGFAMPNRECLVLLGDFSNERLDLSVIERDFGWRVTQTPDMSGLREISRSNAVIAVLIHSDSLGLSWQEALRNSRAAAPMARLIMCHKVQQAHARTQMVDAGAFGVLLAPLAQSEVRQSLGFVWASTVTPEQHAPANRKAGSMSLPKQRFGAA